MDALRRQTALRARPIARQQHAACLWMPRRPVPPVPAAAAEAQQQPDADLPARIRLPGLDTEIALTREPEGYGFIPEAIQPAPWVRPPDRTFTGPSIRASGTLRPGPEWFPAWMKYRRREDNYVFWQDKFLRCSLDIPGGARGLQMGSAAAARPAVRCRAQAASRAQGALAAVPVRTELLPQALGVVRKASHAVVVCAWPASPTSARAWGIRIPLPLTAC
jgi:hypothetical protein